MRLEIEVHFNYKAKKSFVKTFAPQKDENYRLRSVIITR